jgi:uncharacterized protein YndB with AHSA1/START domain
MPATSHGTEVVEHRVRIAARPETVFAYLTDPERMVRWMGIEATLDPRPGGVCRIAFEPARGQVTVMSGKFEVIEPYHRIVFTWGWEQEFLSVPPGATVVEISLTPQGEETVVRLAHRRLSPADVDFHRAGWQHYLERLATAARGEEPGHDPWQVS